MEASAPQCCFETNSAARLIVLETAKKESQEQRGSGIRSRLPKQVGGRRVRNSEEVETLGVLQWDRRGNIYFEVRFSWDYLLQVTRKKLFCD